MEFNSSLTVFAEKVQQMQQAKRAYLAKLKAPLREKTDALEDLNKVESEVDTLLYSILYPSRHTSAYRKIGGG